MQGLKLDLDEHMRADNTFQQVVEYSLHMTNILLGLSDMEIENKQIIEDDIFVQNLHGVWKKNISSKQNYNLGKVKYS
jgi:hypothetical protein